MSTRITLYTSDGKLSLHLTQGEPVPFDLDDGYSITEGSAASCAFSASPVSSGCPSKGR